MILVGDVREKLREIPDGSVQTCITSPPYWGLRDYGVDGQIGLEQTPAEYVTEMVSVFTEVWRVLAEDGTLWLNLGDSYAGSWGAQSRGNTTGEDKTTLGGTSMLSARQIEAHPKGQTQTGSLKRTPGLKNKDLIGVPWRVAFALQDAGWHLRSDIIWHKPNPMPESVRDRPTKSHEYLFLLTKSPKYFYDHEAIKEPAKWERWGDQTIKKAQPGTASWIKPKSKQDLTGENAHAASQRRYTGFNARWDAAEANGTAPKTKNKRSVWSIPTRGYKGAHFAVMPEKLVEPCVLAGSRPGDVVLDPFAGAGTTLVVAQRHGRRYIGIEINPAYVELANERLAKEAA